MTQLLKNTTNIFLGSWEAITELFLRKTNGLIGTNTYSFFTHNYKALTHLEKGASCVSFAIFTLPSPCCSPFSLG